MLLIASGFGLQDSGFSQICLTEPQVCDIFDICDLNISYEDAQSRNQEAKASKNTRLFTAYATL
jgi:hypothetical protein